VSVTLQTANSDIFTSSAPIQSDPFSFIIIDSITPLESVSELVEEKLHAKTLLTYSIKDDDPNDCIIQLVPENLKPRNNTRYTWKRGATSLAGESCKEKSLSG